MRQIQRVLRPVIVLALSSVSTVWAQTENPEVQVSHRLLASNAAVNTYRPTLITAIADSSKDQRAQLGAGGFIVDLEKALKTLGDKARLVSYPETRNSDLLMIAAVVPPKAGLALPIPVCAQQYAKVIAAWTITVNGEVLPMATAANPEGSNKAACQATLFAAKREMDKALAAMSPKD